jgi:hypothetical protein
MELSYGARASRRDFQQIGWAEPTSTILHQYGRLD